MKFVSFLNEQGEERLGFWLNEKVFDLHDAAKSQSIQMPTTMADFLNLEEKGMDQARSVHAAIESGKFDQALSPQIKMLAPVPHPSSCRDAYAFRQHVATARRNRGVDMIPEFDQFPIFYLTNHHAIFGQGELVFEQDHFKRLDFELESAVVIGKRGKNVSSKEADHYIAGFTIMNDWSARQLQMEEMKLNLGPAKGKDFCTCIGPWMVTPDELENKKIQTEFGNHYDLRMTARHNGKLISDGNTKDMTYTFAEIIERVAYGVELHPGDVIGSGTVGTGCYLELNGTHRIEAEKKGETFEPVWVKPGDEMELEIEGLGVLKNKVISAAKDYSILARKKNQ